MSKRIQSTPEQIDQAITAIPYLDPCPYVIAAELCPELEHDPKWAQHVPAHVVIAALHEHAEHWLQLLQEERGRRRETEGALADLTDALRKVYKAATT